MHLVRFDCTLSEIAWLRGVTFKRLALSMAVNCLSGIKSHSHRGWHTQKCQSCVRVFVFGCVYVCAFLECVCAYARARVYACLSVCLFSLCACMCLCVCVHSVRVCECVRVYVFDVCMFFLAMYVRHAIKLLRYEYRQTDKQTD